MEGWIMGLGQSIQFLRSRFSCLIGTVVSNFGHREQGGPALSPESIRDHVRP